MIRLGRRALLCAPALLNGAQSAPPLVIIATDGHGWHLSALGTTALRTPRLDQLAEEGTLYTRAYAAGPPAEVVSGWSPEVTLNAVTPRETYAAALELLRKKPRVTVVTQDRAAVFATARAMVSADDVQVPPSLPDLPRVREEWARYLNFVQSMDALAGAVLDALERVGWTEEALVIYTSLRGPDVRRPLHDSALHVPLLTRGPGLAANRRVNGLVSASDLPQPRPCHAITWKRAEGVTVHDGRFRYIRNREAGKTLPLPAGWEEAKARYPLHWRWLTTPLAEEELYDQAADPDELHNLANDAGYRAELARLRQLV
jgi:arylsulfatase A-like enzyme